MKPKGKNKGKTRLTTQQQKLFDTLLFLAKLLVFAIPLYIIMAFEGLLSPLQGLVTQNVRFMLQAMGFSVSGEGFLVIANAIIFFVSEDCTGWKSMLFLAALIFSVPKVKMEKRLAGLALGLPAVYVGNLLRILLVVFAWHNYGLAFAMMIHTYFWQAGLIALVLALWVSWLAWSGKMKITLLKRSHKIIKPKVRK
jgi:exosortase/archaeosortase family protein